MAKKKEQKKNGHTIADDIRRRLDYIARQEKRCDDDIVRVQKRIDDLPKLEARLVTLKERKVMLAQKKQGELKQLQDLAKQFLAVQNATEDPVVLEPQQ